MILVHDQEWLTYRCLWSISKNAGQIQYEVIVVDDGSRPAVAAMLTCQRNIRLIRLESKQGFVVASNAGAELARGDLILFLNNDTEVLPGALSTLAKTFETFPTCNAAGPKLIYPNGVLQEADRIVWKDGQAWNCGKDGDLADPQFNYLREVDYCSAAALMIRHDLFQNLKNFDPLFTPSY